MFDATRSIIADISPVFNRIGNTSTSKRYVVGVVINAADYHLFVILCRTVLLILCRCIIRL